MRGLSHGSQPCRVPWSAALMCACSCQHQLVGAGHPLGKPLTVSSPRDIVTSQPLDVVRQLLRRHLVPSELATKAGVQSEPTPKMDLVALDLIAVRPDDKLALQTDVCDLDAGARVRTAVEVDGDGRIHFTQPTLELGDNASRLSFGLNNRKLAELNPGAGHHRAAPDIATCRKTAFLGTGDQ